MKILGKDKSTPPKGMYGRHTGRAAYGIAGDWLGVNKEVRIAGVVHHPFVLVTEEKLHIALVPEWCREEVFKQLGATWSWSRNLCMRMLEDAMLLSPKPNIWHHGILEPTTFQGKVTGIEETHEPKPKQVKAPWASPSQPALVPAVEPHRELIRL